MLKRSIAWLQRVPIQDPVDRRNAPMLQLVLLLLGTLPPLLWLYRISLRHVPWRPGETTSLATSLLVSAIAIASILLIRRGRFQWAVRQLLVVVAAVMLVGYAATGLGAQMFQQPVQVMWLFVAGMMIGRSALWLMYLTIASAMYVGATSDWANHEGALADLLGDATVRSVMFLLIAVVVDRAVMSLRESLDEAVGHAQELARSNRALHEQTIAREQAQSQLVHSQKLEAVGRMASGTAHDLNHLLGVIQGYVDQGKDVAASAEVRELFLGIGSATDRATGVARKLLHFSRHDEEAVERFDARDALRELQPMLKQTLGPGRILDLDLPVAPCPIRFDRARFGLVLLSIAANAADAMPEAEGRLTVRLRKCPDEQAIDIALQDDGHGMDQALLPRVFEPFFTTKPPGHGTGLGLAIVGNLVDAANGSVDVASTPGTGTTLRIRLPLAA
jgi:signal transduction histidine kinase